MEPRIVTKPEFTVVGMKLTSRNPRQIARLWRAFGPRITEIRHRVDTDTAYGLTTGHDDRTRRFDYIAGVEVSCPADIPDGMVYWMVPEQEYVAFPCTLPAFVKTYRYVKESWIPAAGYRFAGFPEFELYDERYNPKDRHSQLEFYIPVRQAGCPASALK
jgi:predicted transcriptional regulator YdeE